MTNRIESTHHVATPPEDAPVWRIYRRSDDSEAELVAECWFCDEDDVRTRMERLDADAQQRSLFD